MDTSHTLRQQASVDFFALLKEKDGKVTEADYQFIIDAFVKAGDDCEKVKTWLKFYIAQGIMEPPKNAAASTLPGFTPVAPARVFPMPRAVRNFTDVPGLNRPPPPQ